jgi:hypothetical protein
MQLIRSLTLEYERELFNQNQAKNIKVNMLLEKQLENEHNSAMDEIYDSVMSSIITLLK